MGRPKGSRNKTHDGLNRDVIHFDRDEPDDDLDGDDYTADGASVARGDGPGLDGDGGGEGGGEGDGNDLADPNAPRQLPPPGRAREVARRKGREVELIMRKYQRGAKLLGLKMSEVDRLMGDKAEAMSRRARYSTSTVPLPPDAIARYQRLIPLTEEYLRAPSDEDFPEDRILDPAIVDPESAGRSRAVQVLAKTLRDHGIAGDDQIMRTVEFVVALGYLKMEPQEVFDAAMERKARRAAEEFERARREMKGG